MPTRATWPDGISVTFRSLTWGEYRDVQSLQGPPAEKALEVYHLCIIDGPTPERVPAGIMMWLFQNEITRSPFTGSFQAISVPLQKFREKVTGNYLLSAQAMIASVFKIPFETMDNWDSNTFFTRLAQAEFVSGVPLNPIDPNSPVNKQGQPMRKLKKQLTPAQMIATERKYGPGAAASFNANDIRNAGGTPSKQVVNEQENFTYVNDKSNPRSSSQTNVRPSVKSRI
jgi:hypothetical protein